MNDALLTRLKAHISPLIPRIREFRRDLHSEPEIGLMEYKTHKKIRKALAETSLSFWEPLLGTDVIAELKGKSSRTVCLRADIDALPVEEKTGLPYASRIQGMMHACGHDGHTAILTGAALALNALKEELPVSVRFIFQPGEEKICAGRTLVERGACDDTEAAYALHAWPGLPVGTVSCRKGPIFAAGAGYKIEFLGKGGHGAMPEAARNPIPAVARAVDQLLALHRKVNPMDHSVVTPCVMHAGTLANIIPESAVLEGTFRYLSTERGDQLEETIRGIAASVAQAEGISHAVAIHRIYAIPVVNTDLGAAFVKELAETCLPKGGFLEADKASMGSEDFAYYLTNDRQGAYFRLGMGENAASVHNPLFDFNDEALETGILMFCLIALNS
ncbi:MAG: M20 family metallopeptidase [Fibrobacterota bacterium]